MGWLEKKGEHLKLWRRRFLVLYDDGVFNGYKAAPSEEDIKTGSGTLENLFNVKSESSSVIWSLDFSIGRPRDLWLDSQWNVTFINPFLDSQIIRPPKDECEFILRCKQQNPTSRDKFIERHFK